MTAQKPIAKTQALWRGENFATITSAGIIIFMSLIVIAGWATGNIRLISVIPHYPAMVFNTALGFFFCGLGLLFFKFEKNAAPVLCGWAAFSIGFLSLMEYALGMDFKIDELFFSDFVKSNISHPGRMSISTALCFILTGSTLFLLPPARRFLMLGITLEIFCLINILVSTTSFLDHFGILDDRYSWFIWQSMAIHTSLGFIILNIALLQQIWKPRRSKISPFHITVPLFLLTSALAFDAHTPTGVASSILYMPFVLCAFWHKNMLSPFIFAMVSTILTILGVFASIRVDTTFSDALINRSVAIMGLWTIAALIYIIKIRERSLYETAEKLKAIVDSTVDGIITIDDKGKIESFNKACSTIFGYENTEVIGKNIKVLMPEPYHSEHDTYLENYNTTGEKKIIGIGREVKGKRKNGEIFPLDLSVSEVNVHGYKIYSGIVRDISDRKKSEEEIIRSNEELERFAYIASHDLQEPLRMVANFTGLLEEEYKDQFDEQAAQYMRFIIDAAHRMQDLVGDLLEYSRVGNENSGLTDVDCTSQTELVLSNLKETINEARAIVKLGKLPVIQVKPVRFSQLMQNLIGNALKYRTPDNTPEIKISAEDRGNEWLFSVSDNGIGMQEEYLEQIFIIFKRLHGKKEYQGTGIGLAVCKKIVESFDGKIWAESKIGEGSTFYFTFPKKISERKAA